MIRRFAACKHLSKGKILRPGEFTLPAQKSNQGSHQMCLMGKQVRLPTEELKAYLEEKLAY